MKADLQHRLKENLRQEKIKKLLRVSREKRTRGFKGARPLGGSKGGAL